MIEYTDLTGEQVKMTFQKDGLGTDIKDILVIPYLGDNNWLLTENFVRGLEFPGGKIDPGESIVTAVKRELWEETGVHLSPADQWHFIADYQFKDKKRGHVIKRAYVIELATYIEAPIPAEFETIAVHQLTTVDYEQFDAARLSFYMKDAGMATLWQKAKQIVGC